MYYEVLTPPECSGVEFDIMLSLGWYPMGQTIFTTSHIFMDDGSPHQPVHWLRYPVSSVRDRASHRRIRRKNRSFTEDVKDPFVHSDALDELYGKYLDSVDFDGYESIGKATFGKNGSNIYHTKAIVIREGERIISCGIFHEGASSAASILHFYDPEYSRFSPGKYLILLTLDYCRKKNIEWYYPGYIIEGNSKMDYKLFLGKESAQYYLPEPSPLSGRWEPLKSIDIQEMQN